MYVSSRECQLPLSSFQTTSWNEPCPPYPGVPWSNGWPVHMINEQMSRLIRIILSCRARGRPRDEPPKEARLRPCGWFHPSQAEQTT